MRGPYKSLVRSAKLWGQKRNSNINAKTRREIYARLLGQRYFSKRYNNSCKKKLHNTCGWIFTRPTFAK
ncbi:hypothetical protein PoMZ_02508 [Pyricularia oryzae]|uniref:Uncharacterized protein n=1 Tax=Pyricularia oryzae TaxID=318829 RepID=A0A4P7N4Z1_PYROR|nr:hypothetical protein PoMZ_02508 [Pyricularia oryzae]